MTIIPQALDLTTIKRGQQAMWASGDFGVIASLIHIVAEQLVDSADLVAGSRVLDVAGGTGNAAIAAARCGCDVTCTDYVPALLERGRERARAERLEHRVRRSPTPRRCRARTASTTPSLSVFGAMFAPDQPRAAAELVRVCRPRRAHRAWRRWTPEGFLGELFRATAAHVPPPAGRRVAAALGHRGGHHRAARRRRRVRSARAGARSPGASGDAAEFIDMLRDWYGPTVKAFEAVGPQGAAALERDLIAVVERAARAARRRDRRPGRVPRGRRGPPMRTPSPRTRGVGLCLLVAGAIALSFAAPAQRLTRAGPPRGAGPPRRRP